MSQTLVNGKVQRNIQPTRCGCTIRATIYFRWVVLSLFPFDFCLCHCISLSREFSSTIRLVSRQTTKQHCPPFLFTDFCSLAPEKFNGSENVGATLPWGSDSSRPLLCSFFLSTSARSFTVKRTLIAHTVTPQWDNVNYEQFCKSRHNRGAAG